MAFSIFSGNAASFGLTPLMPDIEESKKYILSLYAFVKFGGIHLCNVNLNYI